MKGRPKTLVLMYVLLVYVVLQFLWWAFLLFDLNADLLQVKAELEMVTGRDIIEENESTRRQLFMVLGEGTVFMTLLFVGAFYIRKFLIREQNLAKQERNFLLATTHEFNSPIAAIKLNLQTIIKRRLNEEQIRKMTVGALGAASRLESLVSNLLIASRIDAGKLESHPELLALNARLHKIVERNRGLAEEAGCVLEYNGVEEEIEIRIDERAFDLIVENLISNAIKYAPKSKILVDLEPVNSHVQVSVTDTGKGISSDEVNHIFRKFYRVENEETRTQKGTGLGLYLVKELVNANDGKIEYQEVEPHGSSFKIKFQNA